MTKNRTIILAYINFFVWTILYALGDISWATYYAGGSGPGILICFSGIFLEYQRLLANTPVKLESLFTHRK